MGHSRAGGNPGNSRHWIPASKGTAIPRLAAPRPLPLPTLRGALSRKRKKDETSPLPLVGEEPGERENILIASILITVLVFMKQDFHRFFLSLSTIIIIIMFLYEMPNADAIGRFPLFRIA
jgi:hypothetical protein